MSRSPSSSPSAWATALLCVVAAAPVWAEDEAPEPAKEFRDAKNEVAIDANWFFQSDKGGNPVQREGVRYEGQRAAVNLQVTDTVRVRGAVAVAKLEDGGNDDDTDFTLISNATRTEASQTQRPTTVNLYADIAPPDTGLRITPGVYYFKQNDYRSAGGSLDFSYELNDGDTVLFAGVTLLSDKLDLDYWDETDRGEDDRLSLSFLAGVSQTLTPRLVSSISLQYVHQQGFLGDPRNVVPLFTGINPTFLADERLPRRRNRIQANGRLRYALMRGWSLGLDVSGYGDDWSVLHGTVEPSVEAALIEDVLILRLWYRIVLQREARYFEEMRTVQSRHQTRDSDLGDFVLHGVGAVVILRSPWAIAGVFPELRGNVFYYDRDDGVDGFEYGAGFSFHF